MHVLTYSTLTVNATSEYKRVRYYITPSKLLCKDGSCNAGDREESSASKAIRVKIGLASLILAQHETSRIYSY